MDDTSTRRLRVRWAAIGAAVAVSLGAGGLGITQAAIGSGERNVFVPITPCRLIDIRPAPDTVGSRTSPLGPGETLTVQVTGTNGNCTIPTDATAVAANVVAVAPTAAGFFTLWPTGVGRPLSANLNFVAGAPPTPNKVDVKLSADGRLDVYNFAGSAYFVLDVFGYYADHNHDDRYQPLGNYQPAGDYQPAGNYQPAGDYLTAGPITMVSGLSGWFTGEGFAGTVTRGTSSFVARPIDFAEPLYMDIVGPTSINGRNYRLVSATWCLVGRTSFAIVTEAVLDGPVAAVPEVADITNRSAPGCYTLNAPANSAIQTAWVLELVIDDGDPGSTVILREVTSVWTPV